MESPRARPARALGLSVALGALLSLSSAAHADSEPIRIEYRAPEGCPSASQFQRQVFARTSAARLAGEVETARAFSIELERRGGKVVGSLTVYEPDGVSKARTFTGRQCKEVALVLALATALAIDPRAELAPQQSGADDGLLAEPEGTEPGADIGTDTRDYPPLTAPTPTRGPPPEVGADDADDETLVLHPPSTPAGPYSFGIAIGPRVAGGTAPGVAAGASLQLAAYAEGAISSVGMEFAWLGTSTTRFQGGGFQGADSEGAGAEFTFLLARPHLCAVRAALGTKVGLRPCLTTELGVVTGIGSELPNSGTARRFWGALELALRLDVEVAGPGFITLDVGAAAPLSRYRFVFEKPETSIYDVSVVSPVAALGIGLRD